MSVLNNQVENSFSTTKESHIREESVSEMTPAHGPERFRVHARSYASPLTDRLNKMKSNIQQMISETQPVNPDTSNPAAQPTMLNQVSNFSQGEEKAKKEKHVGSVRPPLEHQFGVGTQAPSRVNEMVNLSSILDSPENQYHVKGSLYSHPESEAFGRLGQTQGMNTHPTKETPIISDNSKERILGPTNLTGLNKALQANDVNIESSMQKKDRSESEDINLIHLNEGQQPPRLADNNKITEEDKLNTYSSIAVQSDLK